MKARSEIKIFDTPAELAEKAAEFIAAKLSEILTVKNRVSLVISGGSTPKALYTILASEKYKDKIDWNKLLIFFGDERCVPPDSDDSNYKMAYETLLSKVPVPQENIFRMKGEMAPETAAAKYEEEIRNALGGIPVLDIILLGLGPDGHTASLFPETAALNESNKLVAANHVEKLNTWRLTLTFPAINAAKNVIFLVAGKDKAETVKTVFDEKPGPPLPSQLIQPASGNLLWMLDKEAARLI